MPWVEQMELVGLVGLAMLMGGLVGLERELARKPAGLRTLMLVAGAAALFVKLGDILVAAYAQEILTAPVAEMTTDIIQADPIRIVEAIVTGTTILGAGTIWRSAGSAGVVAGLTTAAAVLFVAGIGIAVALDQFVLAAGATVLVLIALRLFDWIERHTLAD